MGDNARVSDRIIMQHVNYEWKVFLSSLGVVGTLPSNSYRTTAVSNSGRLAPDPASYTIFSELSSLVCAQNDLGDTKSSGDESSSRDSELVGLWWNTVPGAISWISFCLLRRRAYRCHPSPAKMAVMARVTATAIAAVAPFDSPEDVLSSSGDTVVSAGGPSEVSVDVKWVVVGPSAMVVEPIVLLEVELATLLVVVDGASFPTAGGPAVLPSKAIAACLIVNALSPVSPKILKRSE